MNFDGTQMPTGSAEDRLCDLDACPRPSQTLVAEADGSILLVCDPCASHMAPSSAPSSGGAGSSLAPRPTLATSAPELVGRAWDVDDTVEIPVVTAALRVGDRDEAVVPAPTPQAALPSNGRSGSRSANGSAVQRWVAARGWSFWARLVLAVAFGAWGSMVMVADPAGYDGVLTCAVGVYLLVDLARPRYRNG